MFESISDMSLFKYFQLSNSSLPKPDGRLSTVVPPSSITAANKEVKQVLDKPEGKDTLTSKRGTMYEHACTRSMATLMQIGMTILRKFSP